VILVSSDWSDYIIYEDDDVKTQMNEEIMDEMLDNHSVKEVVVRVPWARDIIVTTASLPYGDIGMWATQWAEEQIEDLDDDEILERADLTEKKESYEEELAYWEARMDPEVNGEINRLYSDRAEVMVFDYNNMLNELPESARNDLMGEAEEEIEKALKQYPYEYLYEERGWSEKQVLEAFGYLDEDERKSIIRQLGASEESFQYLASSGKRLRTKLNYVIEEI